MAPVFLLVGALGIVVLLLSLFAGELGELGNADADGPFSIPALAALLGGVGFGGAAATAVLPEALPDVVMALLAVVVVRRYLPGTSAAAAHAGQWDLALERPGGRDGDG